MNSTKFSGLAKNAAVLFLGITLALFLGEVMIRVISPRSYVEVSKLGVVGQGGDHDKNGFRNDTIPEHAEIVVLGDSQTYGNNATREEAWPQQLGNLSSTSVYQMAYGGFSSLQYSILAENAAMLTPKIVIVGFYSGNDLLETYTNVYEKDGDWNTLRDPAFILPATTSDPLEFRRELQTGLSRESLEFKIWKVRYWIRLHSRLYELLGDATRGLRERAGVALTMSEKHEQFEEFAKENPEVAYVFSDDMRIKALLSPAYRKEAVSIDEPRTGEGWKITQRNFLHIKERVSKDGIPMVLVFIPTKEYVYLTYFQMSGRSIPIEFDEYLENEKRLETAFFAFCKTHDIYCHSTLPDLAKALTDGEKIYGETMDGHPLALGYYKIAKSVWNFLTQETYRKLP